MAVAVVSIPVRDQVAGRTFYTEVIGLEVLRDEATGPDMRWIQLQPKDGGATIALVTWFQGMPPGGMQGLMLGVEDAGAEYERLSALGIAVSPVDEQPWGRFTMLNDPDGNGLILAQLTAPEEFRTR
ncbi:VOC family protein [Sphingomonas sp.]|uniref:VOC family protein n=1 Tax=Sphingomonas sp. TaxID=28214 RepID=UPI00333FA442